MSGLDFLILALPLTPATTGLIGERELQSLPRHAFLLNPARGPIVQEAALLRALQEGWIAGAALDTHFYYPLPPEHPLWAMPNVIITPHISGSSLSPCFLERVWDIFLQKVDRIAHMQPLLNELTPEQLRGNEAFAQSVRTFPGTLLNSPLPGTNGYRLLSRPSALCRVRDSPGQNVSVLLTKLPAMMSRCRSCEIRRDLQDDGVSAANPQWTFCIRLPPAPHA